MLVSKLGPGWMEFLKEKMMKTTVRKDTSDRRIGCLGRITQAARWPADDNHQAWRSEAQRRSVEKTRGVALQGQDWGDETRGSPLTARRGACMLLRPED